ncbi:hypothetical protein B7P43_G10113, partial [Cryptotermes secundus]
KFKVVVTVSSFFFDSEEVVHHKFLPQGKTVTKEYCLEVMERHVRLSQKKKRPDVWKTSRWMLHVDIAPGHTSLLIRQIPKLEMSLKGRRFESNDSIKENSLADLRNIPNEASQKCFEV